MLAADCDAGGCVAYAFQSSGKAYANGTKQCWWRTDNFFNMSFEWGNATSCPPPRHNFTSLPRIRSERPALDLHHPELAAESPQQSPVDDGAIATRKG